MAYNKEDAIAAQNAGSSAATVYASLGLSVWDPDLYRQIRLDIFNGTIALAGSNAVVETFEGAQAPTPLPAPAPQPVQATTGPQPAGGASSDNGAGVELKFGKYRGQTIEQVFNITSIDSKSGEPEGQSWLRWAAENSNNDFIRGKVREFLASKGVAA